MAASQGEKVRAWMTAAWRDAGFRQRQSDGLREKWKDPEYRARMSAARKRQHEKRRLRRQEVT